MTLLIDRGMKSEDTGAKVQELAGGPIKCALECTGFESSIRSAIFVSYLVKAEGEY